MVLKASLLRASSASNVARPTEQNYRAADFPPPYFFVLISLLLDEPQRVALPGANNPAREMKPIRSSLVTALLAALLLTGCEGITTERADGKSYEEKEIESIGKLFGEISFGGAVRSEDTGGASGIGVNGLLWRASLDTLSFLPLASADPFGGVIITDWYSPPESPNERFKVTAYILGRQLRSDGVRVAVFRQELTDGRGWVDSPVEDQTRSKLEGAILNRARELRIASADQ